METMQLKKEKEPIFNDKEIQERIEEIRITKINHERVKIRIVKDPRI